MASMLRSPRAAVLFLVLLTIFGDREFLSVGWAGYDAFSLVEANRLEHGVGEVLTQEIRGGIEEGVAFWRPLTGISYGLQHALFGLRALPWQLLGLLMHVGCVLLLFGWARRLGGGLFAATVGCVWFALHPLVAEMIPCLARRADLFAGFGLLLGMWLWSGSRPSRPLLALVVIFFALLTKESIIAFPLIFLLAGPTTPPRWRFLYPSLVVGIYLGLRILLFGQLGGYGDLELSVGGLWPALGWLADPADLLGSARFPVATLLPLGLIAFLATDRSARILFRNGGAWLFAMTIPLLLVSGIGRWYLWLLLPGIALLLVAMIESMRRRTPVWQFSGGLLMTLTLLPALICSQLWWGVEPWRTASAEVEIWGDALTALEGLQDLDTEESLNFVALPATVEGAPHRPHTVRSASMLAPWSVSSFLRLQDFPAPPVHSQERAILRWPREAWRVEAVGDADGSSWQLRGGATFDGEGLPRTRAKTNLPQEWLRWDGARLLREGRNE